jgi:flagellar biosynthetic protein FliP
MKGLQNFVSRHSDVALVLAVLGVLMMPPTTIALPLKVLMFVLVDGWALILKALVGSFH